ncbi:rifin [Plasmodium reichenowi]|uniref:Rifin n=1 Tax=Plasmodium reichenowi TaxID=5854 RepID=A0A060RLU5_PLARE|nr:rifin [Plasmodium reichenowi]
MKVHYTKILLFFFPLNILLTSYHEYNNNNEPFITPHHTQTNRSLCESDTESSIYDNDEEINSVKEIFELQTSQRFEEYQERMKEKRQKRKEQRDKNIQKIIHQKIIHKDKMEKNLAEKIEKGCLMCGCGLGSVAGSVGLFGGVAINIWKHLALDAAIKAAIAKGTADIAAAANAAGDAAGAAEIIKLIKTTYSVDELGRTLLESYFATTSYKNASVITQAVYEQYIQTCAYVPSSNLYLRFTDPKSNITMCRSVLNQTQAVSKTGHGISELEGIRTAVETMVSETKEAAKVAAEAARESATNAIRARETGLINTIFMSKQTAIIASVVAILVIVLVMIIIYLVLRYRRKKKMKKKAQYTKLLNE